MGRATLLTLGGAVSAFVGACVFGGRSDLTATEELRCWETAADCNGEAEDGCETDLLSSVEHCGTCENACPSGLACGRGECLPPDHVVEIHGFDTGIVVRTAGGDVWAWGDNQHHRITSAPGLPISEDADFFALPIRVEGFPANAAQIAVDELGICARVAGEVWCRGAGSITLVPGDDAQDFAHRIPGIRDAVHLEAGHGGFCAVDAFGSPLCWGSNADWNMLAVASGSYVPAPPIVPVELTQLPEELRSVQPSLALTADGRVLSWGSTVDDGFPGEDPREAPIREVPGLGRVRRVDRISYRGYCAETEDLRVVCWGFGPTVWEPTFDANGHFVLSTGRRFRRVVSTLATDFCTLDEAGQLECLRYPAANRGNVWDVAQHGPAQCIIRGGDRRVFCNNTVFDAAGRSDQWIEAPIPRDQ